MKIPGLINFELDNLPYTKKNVLDYIRHLEKKIDSLNSVNNGKRDREDELLKGKKMKQKNVELRPFTTWAAQELEFTLIRNDERGKGPWEEESEQYLTAKINEEYDEVVEAIAKCCVEEARTPKRVRHLQDELADLAVTCMMLSALFDPEVKKYRRGYKIKEFVDG